MLQGLETRARPQQSPPQSRQADASWWEIPLWWRRWRGCGGERNATLQQRGAGRCAHASASRSPRVGGGFVSTFRRGSTPPQGAVCCIVQRVLAQLLRMIFICTCLDFFALFFLLIVLDPATTCLGILSMNFQRLLFIVSPFLARTPSRVHVRIHPQGVAATAWNAR